MGLLDNIKILVRKRKCGDGDYILGLTALHCLLLGYQLDGLYKLVYGHHLVGQLLPKQRELVFEPVDLVRGRHWAADSRPFSSDSLTVSVLR